MRLFVALEISDAWRDGARLTQQAVTAALATDPGAARLLRHADPALLHLTLRFAGEVDDGVAARIEQGLRAVPPIDVELELAPAGTFGAAARSSVLWLGVGGDLDGLRGLAERVDAAVERAGLPPGGGRFRPHLTLARVRRSATAAQRRAIAAAVVAAPPPDRAPLRAVEVVLVRSHLGDRQPRYEVLSRHR